MDFYVSVVSWYGSFTISTLIVMEGQPGASILLLGDPKIGKTTFLS